METKDDPTREVSKRLSLDTIRFTLKKAGAATLAKSLTTLLVRINQDSRNDG